MVQPGKEDPSSTTYFSQKADIAYIGKDIKFIKENIKRIKNLGGYFFNNGSTWFLIFSPLTLLGGAFYLYKYKLKLESDVTFAKASRAYKNARKHITQIEKNLSIHHLGKIPLLFEKLLTGYISDKFNIPKSNIVLDRIKKVLSKQKVDNELISKIEDLYNEMNIYRYSPSQSDEKSYTILLIKSNKLINDIEKKDKKKFTIPGFNIRAS